LAAGTKHLSIGVIEGSEEALSYESRYIDKCGYENLGRGRYHVLSSQRERIYALYLSYLRTKRNRGEFDQADR